MHLLEFENYQIVPTEECFLCKPLRDLYNHDTTKNKERFLQQLSVIYHLADPRSSYSYITDETQRLEEIKIQEGLPQDYELTDEIKKAIEEYKKHVVTTSYLLLQDTRCLIDKIRTQMREMDFNEVDSKGRPVNSFESAARTLKIIPGIIKDLNETERNITKEIEEAGRARGGNDAKTLFEDGITLD